MSVFLAIPNLGWVRSDLAQRLISWTAAGNVKLFMPADNRPVDYAKNICIEKFLQGTCDYIWFIDCDTTPPVMALDSLVYADKEMISGVVLQHKLDLDNIVKPVPMICRESPEGLRPVLTGKGIEPIDACGAGCLMIHRSVFDKVVGPPWFEHGCWGEKRGSDFNFCSKVKDAGIPMHAHFGVICTHRKEVVF